MPKRLPKNMKTQEEGKPVRSTNETVLPAAVQTVPTTSTVKVTLENAPLVAVQLLSEIRNDQKRILRFFEEANNGRS